MAYYGKVFAVEKEENLEEFAKSMGVSEERMKNILSFKPNQKFEKDGDNYSVTVYTDKGEKVYKCKSGEEFADTLRDTPVKITLTVDGNIATTVIKYEVGLVLTMKRVYSDDSFVEELTNNKWDGVCRKFYKAI